MTAPPIKRTVATCKSKRRHPDELTARAAGMRAIEDRRDTGKLYVYRCPHCHGWHLTRTFNGVGKLVTADNPVHERQAVA